MKQTNKTTAKATAKEISRKAALKKMGYTALTATAFMTVLNRPESAKAASPAPPTNW